jgi:class 3 adenylate cyclase/tetratricopeptide (TPR) repeat protein
MSVCAACGVDNPPGFRFCGGCGEAMAAGACAACGAANPPEHRFCGRCGAELTAAGREPPGGPGERKLVTVLFADVVGFTTLAERGDPEEVARTVDAAFRRMGEIVVDHGGTVDKYMGDSLMALFGVPQAHDDDAERALAAAMAMRDVSGELDFSTGVNSGEVMVTSVGRDGDVTVIGDVVNVAARLEKAAAPGEILVGPLTAELAARGIVLRQREPLLLKGRRDPVAIWEAVSLRSRDAATGASRLPLVGRDDELDFLRSCWRRVVRSRRAEVVRLVGEAGMGKTRLLDELAATVAPEAHVARSAYPAYGAPSGPRVTGDIARQLGSVGDADADARIATLIGAAPPTPDSAPANLRQETVWALRRLLRARADGRPVLLTIDDTHRAGEAALDLFAEVMARVVEAPVLLVLAGRPQPPQWLAQPAVASTLVVPPLAAEDARALLDALLPERRLDPADAELLVRRAGGNPLHLRELVRLLDVEGYGARGTPALPATLQSVLAARLDALPAGEKTALLHLALFDEGAGDAELAAVGLTEAEAPLRRLVAAGLASQHEDGRHSVVDPLLREVAYEAIPRELRGQRHRFAAGALDDPAEAARHLDQATRFLPDDAGLRAHAAAALATAATPMLNTHRHAEGIRLLERAVELGVTGAEIRLQLARALLAIQRGPEVERVLDAIAVPGEDPRLAAEILLVRANAVSMSSPTDSLALFDEAHRRWTSIGDRGKQAWALTNSGLPHFLAGDGVGAVTNLEAAMAIFEQTGDRNGLTAARSMFGVFKPEDPRVGAWFDESLGFAEQIGDRSRQRVALEALVWHHTMRSRWGGPADTSTARAHAERLARLGAEAGDTHAEMTGLALATYLCRVGGDIAEACGLAERLRALPGDDPSSVATVARAALFSVDSLAGTAQPQPPVVTKLDPLTGFALVIVAESLALLGRLGEARACLPAAGRVDALPLEAMVVSPACALVALLRDQAAEAEVWLEIVARNADAIDAGPAGVAGRALQAEIALAAGDAGTARLRLDEVGERRPGGLAALLLLRARERLGETSSEAVNAAADALLAPALRVVAAPVRR